MAPCASLMLPRQVKQYLASHWLLVDNLHQLYRLIYKELKLIYKNLNVYMFHIFLYLFLIILN